MFFWPSAATAPSAIDSTEMTMTIWRHCSMRMRERDQDGAQEQAMAATLAAVAK